MVLFGLLKLMKNIAQIGFYMLNAVGHVDLFI